MNIVVCIKQVPDTTEVKLDPNTGTLIRDGVPSIINPDDKAGLEEAIKLKEEMGAHITVITMGPPQADMALKEALAMGADRAILLTDRAFAGADTWATSSALAGALKNIDFDIIIAGRQAIDGDTAQVGPQIAEHLNLPSITYAEEIKTEGEYVLVKRQFEDCCHDLKVKMPCLITTLKDMNTPRYMKVGRIYDAFENDVVETWTVKDIEVDPSNLGLKGSPTSVFKSFTKSVKPAGTIYNEDAKTSAGIIIDKLKEKYII
ncbi:MULTISPECIES: electron transfer flavoprotein subunit beta/FixA family protein [unclassified Clostridioides]|uniref:electron transfer flavoprotein subunit beta/FixA family protein n=1 Tax=unclassified Clostridioides TaxID=2635829 RepID=UPI001D0FB746|nr:electron transfer flavoprotein subunit beta/FixA family protein [Clostridioides sp. ES-S-0171-01]MCC0686902.1 electron transfer flavoprotein subunit beta/FixA family protein [Clostridioides sp. ES-S-0056-01]MCC0714272.1 electron transfer flavoprotein subunit beta/FixA family protein [Clostridioides sp. ES-S-0077-01]UDN55551.1 electron transfer flavoprotein subunit beta/FixA family protein [Clostridioides sp. ES-S-0054-01]